MHLVVTGCEYSGTTTLSHAIAQWMEATFDDDRHPAYWGPHDHFKIPHVDHEPDADEAECLRRLKLPLGTPEADQTRDGLSDEEQRQVLALSPKLKEMFQRFSVHYHLQSGFYETPDHSVVGMHIDEAVYAPLYFGYGGKGQYAERAVYARTVEKTIMSIAPETVHVLVKASPEVITRRMKENPHKNAVLQEKDIGYVLARFQEEYGRSKLANKLSIDTSNATVQESLAEFVGKMEEFFTDADRARIAAGRAKKKG